MNRMFDRWKENVKKNPKMAAIVLVALLFVGAIGFAAAKYVSNYQKEAEIHASNFHFSSNYLEYDAAPQFTVSDWGDHYVQFLLFNYEQENIALISETDILYRITVSDDWSVAVVDAAGNTVSPTDGIYTMKASTVCTSHCVTLTYTGTGDPTNVSVSVQSTSPYKKELKADFLLSGKKGIEYEVEDKGDYNIVTIRTNNYYGSVTVTWNSETHSPDNTCDYMGTWRDGTPGTLTANEYTTYTLIFVENKSGSYSKDAFKVEMGG